MATIKSASRDTHATTAELHEAGRSLAIRLRREIRLMEARYEMTSDRLEGALVGGEIRETAEVVEWLIAYRTLRDLADEREARRQ
jgi:hypothetical protein